MAKLMSLSRLCEVFTGKNIPNAELDKQAMMSANANMWFLVVGHLVWLQLCEDV